MNTERQPDAESESAAPPVPAVDWLLQHFVSMFRGTPVEMGITLQVGGLLVSGKLADGMQYFEGIASDFAQAFAAHPELAKTMKASFESLGKKIYPSDAPDEDGRPPPSYIHLRGARFFTTTGKPIPADKGVWWRGRISEVGGFTLGELQFQPDN